MTAPITAVWIPGRSHQGRCLRRGRRVASAGRLGALRLGFDGHAVTSLLSYGCSGSAGL